MTSTLSIYLRIEANIYIMAHRPIQPPATTLISSPAILLLLLLLGHANFLTASRIPQEIVSHSSKGMKALNPHSLQQWPWLYIFILAFPRSLSHLPCSSLLFLWITSQINYCPEILVSSKRTRANTYQNPTLHWAWRDTSNTEVSSYHAQNKIPRWFPITWPKI